MTTWEIYRKNLAWPESHWVDVYGDIYEEIKDEDGNVIDEEFSERDIIDETEISVSRVMAKPFCLCIEWEDANGWYDLEDDDRISYKDHLSWSWLTEELARRRRSPSPEYIRACWKWLAKLHLDIPDPSDYSALRADVERARPRVKDRRR